LDRRPGRGHPPALAFAARSSPAASTSGTTSTRSSSSRPSSPPRRRVLARWQEAPYVPVGAAVARSTIALVWVLSNRLETARAFELVACAVFACAVLHVFCEWGRSRHPAAVKEHDLASAVGAGGMLAVLFAAAYPSKGADVWTLVAGFALVPLFLLRLDALAPKATRPYLACIPAGLGVAFWMQASFGAGRHPGYWSTVAAVFVAPVLFLGSALARKHEGGRRSTFAASAIACLPLFSVLELRFARDIRGRVPAGARARCLSRFSARAARQRTPRRPRGDRDVLSVERRDGHPPIDPERNRSRSCSRLPAIFSPHRSPAARSGRPPARSSGRRRSRCSSDSRAQECGGRRAGASHAIRRSRSILFSGRGRSATDARAAASGARRDLIARLGLNAAALAFRSSRSRREGSAAQWRSLRRCLPRLRGSLSARTTRRSARRRPVGADDLVLLVGRSGNRCLRIRPRRERSRLRLPAPPPLVAAGLVGHASEVGRLRRRGRPDPVAAAFALRRAGLGASWITVEVENRFAVG
jgi:hypothetical protein